MIFYKQINKQQHSLILGVLLLFFINSIFAQNPKENDLFIKAKELICYDPDEAIKIGRHLIENANNKNELAAFNLLLTEAYQTKGDYENMVNHIFPIYSLNGELDDYHKIKSLYLKSEILQKLYLDSQSAKYYQQAQALLYKFSQPEQKELIVSNKINRVFIYLDRFENKSALEAINDFNKSNELDPKTTFRIHLAKALAFNASAISDSASHYLNKVEVYLNKNHQANNYDLALFQLERSKIYYSQKQYHQAIELLENALEIANFLENKLLLREIHKQLSLNFLILNDNENYKLHDYKFINLINEVNDLEQVAVNNAFNKVGKELAADYDDKESNYTDLIKIGLILLIIVTSLSIVLYLKRKGKVKRFKEIIRYLEISAAINSEDEITIKKTIKKTTINQETEQAIFTKLKKFEASGKFRSKDISLAALAVQIDTNTKYLSEIINEHYGKNFNSYINMLRIDFIVKKLKTDPAFMHYKISYLASECGFSTHSIFSTVFKANTGISPNIFIELLKKEMESNSIL